MILMPATPSSIPPTVAQLTGITYTQSGVYAANSAATYANMNNNNADGSANGNETATTANNIAWVQADAGATMFVDHIVVGYDYLSNLAGGFGVAYLEGCIVEGSNDGSSYTQILAAIPTYASTGSSDGLYSITVGANYRYIRVRLPTGPPSGYVAILEFQVWGY